MEEVQIAIIKEWSMLKYNRNIQVLLEFANLYRWFLNGFLRIVRPMTAILKGCKKGKVLDSLKLLPEIQVAFWHLYSMFTKFLILAHFNCERLISLEIDASEFAIAGIILQPPAALTAFQN
jgi:hypothetical protein